jgi:DNA-binding response OmpR family regulator
VVDDEFIVAHTVATMLRLSHYEVGRANDGIIALQRLRERFYHLILSDIKMPGLDGIGLYRAVQEQYPHLGPRFIFMTGATLGSEPLALLEQFGTPCIRKPFVLEELLALIRQVLTRQ